MTPSNEQPTRRLLNTIDALWDRLHTKAPSEVDELRLLLSIIEKRGGRDNPSPYSPGSKPGLAVNALFLETGASKMTKGEIFSELHSRGFQVDSSSRKGAVNNAINRLVENGTLQKFNEEEGVGMLVGPAKKR